MRSTIPLHDRIRGLAAERHYTQDTIGNALGITRPAVRRRFNGTTDFSASEMQKLADLFKLPISSLYGDTAAETADQR